MPVVKIENINDDSFWGLWKIEETTDSLLSKSYLSEEEINELSHISNLKRKKEWLGARVMLKQLIEQCSLPYYGTYKDENKKPYLHTIKYHISIAHCFPFAVTLVNKKHACGIDIEKPKPALFHIAPKFLATDEISSIKQKPDDLCLAWAAKEVLYKLHGNRKLSFKENLHLEPYSLDNKQGNIKARIALSHYCNLYLLGYEILDGFLVCYSN